MSNRQKWDKFPTFWKLHNLSRIMPFPSRHEYCSKTLRALHISMNMLVFYVCQSINLKIRIISNSMCILRQNFQFFVFCFWYYDIWHFITSFETSVIDWTAETLLRPGWDWGETQAETELKAGWDLAEPWLRPDWDPPETTAETRLKPGWDPG